MYDRGQYEKGYSDGYAKAIDEFSERLKSHYKTYKCVPSIEMIIEIAEEMKQII